MSKNGPIALITGANRGLGLEVCRQLAERGCVVVLTARDPAKAANAVKKLRMEAVLAQQLDVTDRESVARVHDRVARDFGHLDILVNNAAINYDDYQSGIDANLDTVRETIETNVLGAWRTTQTLLPLLRKSRHGRIVNVSSGAGSLADMGRGVPAYRVSKTSLNALTRIWAAELADSRILVNSVCPGWVATDMGGAGGRPVAEGAAGIVWAALLDDDGPSGGFFRDGRPVPW